MRVYLVILILSIVSFCFGQFAWEEPVSLYQIGDYEMGNTVDAADGVVYPYWETNSTGEYDLFLQKVSTNGTYVWGTGIIADNKLGNQMEASIVKSSDNNFIAVWKDTNTDNYGDIYIQKFTSSGQRMWQAGGIPLCTTAGNQYEPSIVANNNGGAYVSWYDERDGGKAIYGACINNSGTNLWTDNGLLLSTQAYANNVGMACTDNNSLIMGILGSDDSYFGQPNTSSLIRANDSGIAYTVILEDSSDTCIIEKLVKLSNNTIVIGQFKHNYPELSSYLLKCFNENLNDMWSTTIIGSTLSLFPQQEGSFIVQYNGTIPDHSGWYWLVQKFTADGNPCWGESGCELEQGMIDMMSYTHWTGNGTVYYNNYYYIIYTEESSGQYSDYTCGLKIRKINTSGELVGNQNMYAYSGISYSDDLVGNILFVKLKKAVYPQEFRMSLFNLDTNLAINHFSIETNNTAQNLTGYYSFGNNSTNSFLFKTNDGDINFNIDKYYFQKVSSNGEMSYLNPGSIISQDIGNQSGHFGAIQTTDNHYVLVKNLNIQTPVGNDYSNSVRVYDQNLVQTDSLIMNSWEMNSFGSKVKVCKGEYYSWLSYSSEGDACLSRVNNGLIEWEVGAIVVAENSEIISLGDQYFLARDYQQNQYRMYLKRYTEEGLIVSNWPQIGVTLFNYSNPYSLISVGCYPLAQGYFIIWQLNINSAMTTSACFVDKETGQIVWTDPGILPSVATQVKVIGEDNCFYLSYLEGDSIIKVTKYLWNGTTLNVVPGFTDVSIVNTTDVYDYCFTKVGPRLVFAWQQDGTFNKKVMMRSVSAQYGSLDNHPGGVGISSLYGEQHSMSLTALDDNYLYVNWLRNIPGIGGSQLLTQKIDLNAFVSNSDTDTPNLSLHLKQNYPNPFNPETKITFTIPVKQKVKLEIFNIKGQKVMTIMNGELAEGTHDFVWKGTDEKGHKTASGLYFYRLVTDRETLTRKMLLLK